MVTIKLSAVKKERKKKNYNRNLHTSGWGQKMIMRARIRSSQETSGKQDPVGSMIGKSRF